MARLTLVALLFLALPAHAQPPLPVDATYVTTRRPVDCKPRRMRNDLRVLHDCSAEEVMRVPISTLSEDAKEAPLPRSTHPVVVPSELVSVFRICPFEPVAALDAASDRFIAYEDRDVGRCYLYAPLDRVALAKLGRYDARDHLGTLHPYLRAVMLRALAEAAAAGFQFRVISGVRPGGKPSWHTFGLAVDVNLAHRLGLREATAAYLAGGDERRAWLAFVASAERLGVYWLGKNDPGEIFHFEWRPGWTGLPRGELARELGVDVARGGPAAVWTRLRYDPKRATAMKALQDEPAHLPP